MRRILLRMALLLVILLALAGLSTQILLRTDLPRQIVLNALRSETGLHIHATSLETGWAGRTTVRNLTVALPLETDPFLSIPRIEVAHAGLLRLLLFRQLDLRVVEVDDPHIQIRPNDAGHWNVLKAAEIVTATRAGRPPEEGFLQLPSLGIQRAMIDIAAPDGRMIEYGPVEVTGEPDGPLTWRFTVGYAPTIAVAGRISTGGSWSHEVRFSANEIQALIQPWLPDAPVPLELAGTWEGDVRSAELTGRLRIDSLRADAGHARGEVKVMTRGPELLIDPSGLVLTIDETPIQDATLISGRLRTDGSDVRAEKLRISMFDTEAQLSALWNLHDESGTLDLRWMGRVDEYLIVHNGALTASLRLPLAGSIEVEGELVTRGEGTFTETATGEWDGAFRFHASGTSWRTLRARVHAPRLLWTDELGIISGAGLDARLRADWPLIYLTHLHLPGAEVQSRVHVNAETLGWSIALDASRWTLPRIALDPFDLAVQARGQWTAVHDVDIVFSQPNRRVRLVGRYDLDDLHPLHGRLSVDATITEADDLGLTGRARAEVDLVGTVVPLDLAVSGEFVGKDLVLFDEPAGDVEGILQGRFEPGLLTLESSTFEFADGQWTLRGTIDPEAWLVQAEMDVTGLAIRDMSRLLGVPADISGVVSATMRADLPLRQPEQLFVDASWEATALHGTGLVDASGAGLAVIRDRQLTLREMRLVQGGGIITGDAWLDLEDPSRVRLDFVSRDWPISLEAQRAAAKLNGSAGIELALPAADAEGDIDITLDIVRDAMPLGALAMTGRMRGRDLDLTALRLETLDGHAEGSGRLVLLEDRWLESALDLRWENIDLAQLAPFLPQVKALRGISRGELTVGPAVDHRAPEPMRISIDATLEDGALDAISIGALRLRGYVGQRRALIEDSTLDLANGTAGFWGRLSRHGDEYQAHGYLKLEQIDVQQLVEAARLTDEPTPGRVSGWGSIGGYLKHPNRLFGQAQLELSQSDLVSLPGIAAVYSILNIDFGSPEPTGEGHVTIRLENDALDIVPLTYFNRGIDVVARLRIEDIWAREDSPISGFAAGTVRPLRDVDLPLVGRLDRLISAVQTNVASVRMSGTLAERQVDVVPFGEITGALGRILRGTVD